MGPLRTAIVAAMLLVLTFAVPTTAQPEVEFGRPSATGAFGESVVFTTDFATEAQVVRVEMLSRQPGDDSDLVTIADVTGGAGSWTASVYQGGHVVPNTTWDFRFRVVTDEGAATGPAGSHRLIDERFEWDVLEGEVVNVWTYEGGDDFAREALGIAEEAINGSAELLGIEDIEPVDFLLYTDNREFRDAMGPATRENVGGQAHPRIRTLFGLIEPRQIDSDWADELITHELAHLVFHEAVDNPYQYPPRWLNEGLAVYLSKGYADEDRRRVQGAAGGGTIIPLEGLGGQFPTRPGRQSLAYAVSISAVDYFVDRYGQDRLVELITAFGEGSGLDGAFLAATGEDFASFDAAWLDSLGADAPEPYGPTESAPGPVPESWATDLSLLLR